jgi:inositol oxygenase
MHKNQTLDFVKGKYNQYNKLNNKVMDIHTALSLLDDFIDPSDPDLDLENSIHAYKLKG